ncbi:MAG: AraC family transcriptional regulator [Archangium gephyra]|uniref:AraC family transcriptional regulator n=1 Tax=Archangium gephyra TaxID=48 RepID=A0A2W5UL53_9BACT|nr:MAG: AraC family transcriptional regulator [Archangium gephyra]
MTCRVEFVTPALRALTVRRVTNDQPFVGIKEQFLISRFEAGHSEFWTHGRSWTGAPGTVVVFEPGDVHRDTKRDGFVTYQLISFDTSHLDNVTVPRCFTHDDVRGLAFQRLHDAVNAGADRFTLECALTEAIAAMGSLDDAKWLPTRPVRRALSMLRENLTEAISLDALAAFAGLDKFHLCRAFRAQLAMPPHAYLTQLRIMQAKQLLSGGTKPRDIAHQVGLYDQSQLNRHFRKIVGMTPGQYFAKKHQGTERTAR